MTEVRLTKNVSFRDYVLQDFPIEHSGVLSPVLHLDPEYREPHEKMLNSLDALEKHAHYSITAYRAIAWWAFQLDIPDRLWWRKLVVNRAAEILKCIEKPKEYFVFSGERRIVE